MGLGSMNSIHNLESVIQSKYVAAQNGVAAGTGDNTELTSPTIDRQAAGAAGFMSMVLAVAYLVSLTAAETLKITIKIADSADDSTYSAYTTLINAVTLQTGALVATKAIYELGLDLAAYKRYVRFRITMDLSAGATDTFVYGATAVLGGADAFPV